MVGSTRCIGGPLETATHAQVDEEPTRVVEVQDDELPAAGQRCDRAISQCAAYTWEAGCDALGPGRVEAGDALPDESGAEVSDDRLDLGEFGHGRIVAER